MILKFGKHKGRHISDVPRDYIEWLINSQEQTLKEYKAEIERRDSIADADMSWEQKIIKAGFRALSMKHHPDKGGNVGDMKNLNAAHEKLKTRVRA